MRTEPSTAFTEIVRRSLACTILTILLLGTYTLSNPFTWNSVLGTALTAFAMTVMIWSSDRVRTLLLGPYLTIHHPVIVLAVRLPFWFMGGALGYPFGLLMAKSMDLLIVRDIMVSDLYFNGGCIGVAAEGIYQFMFRPGRRPDHSTQIRG